MKKILIFLFATISITAHAQKTYQNSSGNNSPNFSNINGDVTIDYSKTIITHKRKSKPLHVLDIAPPRNNEEMGSTRKLITFFDDLNKLNGKIVYIRFYTYVGAGIGFDDVPKNKKIKAGVVFNLDNYLDGFGGNSNNYSYGYSIELDGYRNEWGSSRQATLLFPKNGNAFFEVHYMKSMRFEGLAKIKVSGMQGFEWIEIIPAQPFGNLMDQYEEINSKMKAKPNGNFEF